MADEKKIEKMQKEIENLEIQYEQSQKEALFDKSRQASIYKQLKKKRKQLEELQKE